MLNILLLCVANSARSQMAEGIGRELLSDIAYVKSAGYNPKTISPIAIEVLKEIDIDISHQKAKSFNSIKKEKFDIVIILCAEEICPAFPENIKKLHWSFPDPAIYEFRSNDQLKLFRKIRDELKNKIQELREKIKARKI